MFPRPASHKRAAERHGALRRWSVALLAAFLLATGQSFAQLPDSQGKEFILMFNQNISSQGTQSLFLTGSVATTGSVDVPALGFSTAFNVVPGTVTTVTLPTTVDVTTNDTVENKAVFVTAEDEIAVYGLNQRSQTTDAFLGLPTDILGTSYINQGYENHTTVFGTTQFGIAATTDNTTVTITPTETVGVRTAGVPYNIVMNRGDTYQLASNGNPADLSGTPITSDEPIAVFGGHQCGNVPRGQTFCDHMVEQLPPTSTWGQAFGFVPLATRLAGDTLRVLAAEDNTTVSIDGVVVANLSANQNYETMLATYSVITTDKPVLVTQYSNSTSVDNVTSDPFQVTVPPFEQFQAGYTVSTPATGFSINFINVVAPNAAIGSITLDGAIIPAGAFSPIGTSAFSGAQVEVALGSHTLAGPLPFGVTSYGFASFDSYGYPGGLALAEVAELEQLLLNPPTAQNPINTEHCVTATTLDQNSLPLPGIRVDFDVAGVNTVSGFGFTDTNGEIEFCYIGGSTAGVDTITASVGETTATAQKTWVAGGGPGGVVACDVLEDGEVDRIDAYIIAIARGMEVAPGSLGDYDSDGVITRRDFKSCLRLVGTIIDPPE